MIFTVKFSPCLVTQKHNIINTLPKYERRKWSGKTIYSTAVSIQSQYNRYKDLTD